ncbi:hypothetical protein [Spiroplasma melliferum]|uniref:Lipoprotein n=2 Tax=Spiroplasma melliferum TaxID=2134 RepID=A0AAI9T3B0_SPIME|nr:hypothetical protein [Spiroplasma melliferum]KAI92628.1 hypothetical protein SPM_000740 [Spiroplasma melliferum KC3]QCO24224.1 hypothetical protein SRED_002712 [Spiroplasma melliferum]
MKRLLTLFSVFVLGFGSSLGVVSCTARAKHELDDNDELDRNQDLEILNQIKKETKETLLPWWQTKAMIDIIKDYPEQISSFEELVAEVKAKNDGFLTLTSTAISEYGFLNQLLVGFKAEFNNLNQHLRDRYSNYYVDTMPLFLGENDISFDLYNINFDKIAKLLADTPQAVLGITVQVNIPYEVRFKGISSQDNIQVSITTTNDSEVLNNIQDKVENYFVNFLDTIFKVKNYRIISEQSSINKDIVWSIISKELKDRNILFQHHISFTLPRIRDNASALHKYSYFYKHNSVLTWAGEGYDPQQLTWQNFLSFYKEKMIDFENIQIEDGYYVLNEIGWFIPKNFMIENLLFKNNFSYINLKEKSYFTILKTQFDQQLEEFVKVTMDFWHYYQLEKYNSKLVFKIDQDIFNSILSNYYSKSSKYFHYGPMFENYIFNRYQRSLQNPTPWYNYISSNSSKYSINWIKNQKSLMMEIKYYDSIYNNVLKFGYYGLGYSFWFFPKDNEKNSGYDSDGKWFLLKKIEFKLI